MNVWAGVRVHTKNSHDLIKPLTLMRRRGWELRMLHPPSMPLILYNEVKASLQEADSPEGLERERKQTQTTQKE